MLYSSWEDETPEWKRKLAAGTHTLYNDRYDRTQGNNSQSVYVFEQTLASLSLSVCVFLCVWKIEKRIKSLQVKKANHQEQLLTIFKKSCSDNKVFAGHKKEYT